MVPKRKLILKSTSGLKKSKQKVHSKPESSVGNQEVNISQAAVNIQIDETPSTSRNDKQKENETSGILTEKSKNVANQEDSKAKFCTVLAVKSRYSSRFSRNINVKLNSRSPNKSSDSSNALSQRNQSNQQKNNSPPGKTSGNTLKSDNERATSSSNYVRTLKERNYLRAEKKQRNRSITDLNKSSNVVSSPNSAIANSSRLNMRLMHKAFSQTKPPSKANKQMLLTTKDSHKNRKRKISPVPTPSRVKTRKLTKTVEVEKNGSKHTCSSCNSSFAVQWKLKLHELSHSGKNFAYVKIENTSHVAIMEGDQSKDTTEESLQLFEKIQTHSLCKTNEDGNAGEENYQHLSKVCTNAAADNIEMYDDNVKEYENKKMDENCSKKNDTVKNICYYCEQKHERAVIKNIANKGSSVRKEETEPNFNNDLHKVIEISDSDDNGSDNDSEGEEVVVVGADEEDDSGSIDTFELDNCSGKIMAVIYGQMQLMFEEGDEDKEFA